MVADIIAANLPRIAEPGELIFTPLGIQMTIGGHCANVSINLRKLGIPKGKISAIGAVGMDPFGDFIEQTLIKYDIKTHISRVKIGTSKDLILVIKNTDRRCHVEVGANLCLKKQKILEIIQKEPPNIFYLGGAGLLGKLDREIAQICAVASELNVLTFVDIVQPFQKDWDYLESAFKYIDIFHCNKGELLGLTNASSIEKGLKTLIQKGVQFALVSDGPNGLYALTRSNLQIKQPAFSVSVVDPTGAGDALCSGIIYHLIKNFIPQKLKAPFSILNLSAAELSKILMFGQACSAACIMAIGTTTGVDYKIIEDLIKHQGISILKNTIVKKD